MQKAILEQEPKKVDLKKDKIEKTFKFLDEEFAANVEKADKENDITYISKTNSLKRKSNEKKIEFKKLEQVIGILQGKRKSLRG